MREEAKGWEDCNSEAGAESRGGREVREDSEESQAENEHRRREASGYKGAGRRTHSERKRERERERDWERRATEGYREGVSGQKARKRLFQDPLCPSAAPHNVPFETREE